MEIIEFLGVWYNLRTLTMSVTLERLEELMELLKQWWVGRRFKRNNLEVLLGKLQFVSNCVRPARALVLRLRNRLRGMGEGWYSVDNEMFSDIRWWIQFLEKYNGVSIMWMLQEVKEDHVLASDACMSGMGAICGNEYISSVFPEWCQQLDYQIHHLEMLAIVVSLKVWKHRLTGKRFVMLCDNEAVVQVVNVENPKDPIL